MKILAYDDSPFIRDFYEEVLGSVFLPINYTLFYADNYSEFSKLKDQHYSLAIVDWRLDQGIRGDHAIDQICADKIIIVSGYVKEDKLQEYSERSGIDVISKPVEFKKFKEKLITILFK